MLNGEWPPSVQTSAMPEVQLSYFQLFQTSEEGLGSAQEISCGRNLISKPVDTWQKISLEIAHEHRG